MAHLILFIAACYAAWYVFSTAELPIWYRLRDLMMSRSETFTRFVYCPMCSGFWVSWALAIVFPLTKGLIVLPGLSAGALEAAVLGSFIQALAGAGSIYLIEEHVTRLKER